MEKDKLLQLTRDVLDLKSEKKDYNKDMNERIKELEESIKAFVKSDSESLEL